MTLFVTNTRLTVIQNLIFSRYTPCTKFQNRTTALLVHEVIKVTCLPRQQHFKKRKTYEDVYIALKKLKTNASENNFNSWNVLLLGMNTMSRMRAYHSIPKTIKYFKNNNWLDYRKFLKVNYVPSSLSKKIAC